ncbi:MAG: DUF547 domain-containing protein [Pirellulales bacterium]|nr:DUF547 domain-containing protein [Pirellulales bacterium]
MRSLSREISVVGKNIPAAERVPVTQLDHSEWDALVKKYVDGRGFVDYSGWKASAADRQALLDYLGELSRADVPLPDPPIPLNQLPPKRDEKLHAAILAYWINAYNALTIEGILREYPTDSIRNFTAEYWGYNIWQDLLLPVGETRVSLDEIEHARLRPLGDFRIHFAIVCASRGCPPLRNEAYTPERIEDQLSAQARRFLNDVRNFRYVVESENKKYIHWSPLLAWYSDDFGPDRATQMHRLSKWIDDEETRRITVNPDTFVQRNEYDWGLNDQATAEPAADSDVITAADPPPESSDPAPTSSDVDAAPAADATSPQADPPAVQDETPKE